MDCSDRDAIWFDMVVPGDHWLDLWDHPLGGGTDLRDTNFLADNPHGTFRHRACFPGMGRPRHCKRGPIRSGSLFRRRTPSFNLCVLARSSGPSRRSPYSFIKIKPGRDHRAGGTAGSPILGQQSDRGGRHGIYRNVEQHFHGWQFSSPRDQCLWSDTSCQTHPVLCDDRVWRLESFRAEAKDNG